jgi:phage-related protein
MQLEYRYSVLSGVFCFLLIVATFASPVFATQQAEKDITRQELLNFDRFLDSHPAIDQELKKNPALVNDTAYLSAHPELKEFLGTHPGVREEIRENPRIFMNREERFDRSGRDITRQELQNFDGFLDKHPNVEQDLKKNPKLLNDAAYLSAHPELKQFLETHPGVRAEASENPRIFMNRERHFENSGRDIPVQEVKSFDDFMDKHSAIEGEVRRDPSLLNNADYLAKHPELKTYLDQHPRIRQELAENPRALIRAEKRFDKKEAKAERREERIERTETRRPLSR